MNPASCSVARAPSCGFPFPEHYFLKSLYYSIISSKGLSAHGFRSRYFGRWGGNSYHNLNLDSFFKTLWVREDFIFLPLNILSFFKCSLPELSVLNFFCQTKHIQHAEMSLLCSGAFGYWQHIWHMLQFCHLLEISLRGEQLGCVLC